MVGDEDGWRCIIVIVIIVVLVIGLFVIVIATGVGFWIRARAFPCPSTDQIKALDGLSVLAFSAIVVGLMAVINPATRSEPGDVARWMILAFAALVFFIVFLAIFARFARLWVQSVTTGAGIGIFDLMLSVEALVLGYGLNVVTHVTGFNEIVYSTLLSFVGWW